MKLCTLVLNINFVPIGILTWKRSIILYLDGMEVIAFYDNYIRDTAGRKYQVPSVMRTDKYIKINFSRVRLNNNNLFARDKYVCQYCGHKFQTDKLTCDHIIPKSKWKLSYNYHCWTNVTTSCFKCNNKKADKTLEQSGMKLLSKPLPPKMIDIVAFQNNRKIPIAWEQFLV